MVDFVYRWVMEFNVSVRPASLDVAAKLTLMNVLHNPATTVEFAKTSRKATNANVHPDTVESTVKKRNLNVKLTLAQPEQCAKTSLESTMSLVFAEAVILEKCVMSLSIHAQLTEIHVQIVDLAPLCNKADSSAIVLLDGKDRLVK